MKNWSNAKKLRFIWIESKTDLERDWTQVSRLTTKLNIMYLKALGFEQGFGIGGCMYILLMKNV